MNALPFDPMISVLHTLPVCHLCHFLFQSDPFLYGKPIAFAVNINMAVELRDSINIRRKQMNYLKYPGFYDILGIPASRPFCFKK
jgi:hypothetical protein